MTANFPNSHLAVVSTMGLAIQGMLDGIKAEIPNAKYVYDEKLTFESTVEKFRSDNNMKDKNTDLYPIFSFRRSVLRHTPNGASKRIPIQTRTRQIDDNSSEVYTAIHGEIDIEFVYYTKQVEDLERFEVAYLAEEGISALKQFDVDLVAQTGQSWTYFLEYDGVLSDKSFASDNFYYKAVSGTIKMRGFYLLLRETAKHINDVKLKIQSYQQEVFYQNA